MGAAPRQRGVDVEAATPRPIEDWLGQDQAVGDDDRQIGFVSHKIGLRVEIAQRERMTDLYAQAFSRELDRRRALRLAAAGGAGRLGVRRDDLVPRLVQRRERRNRELGRAHEDDPHCHPS